jgi:hypothetical protein
MERSDAYFWWSYSESPCLLDTASPSVASGIFWMHHGVDMDLRGDFQAAALTLEMVGS